jgi:hypothetical protein
MKWNAQNTASLRAPLGSALGLAITLVSGASFAQATADPSAAKEAPAAPAPALVPAGATVPVPPPPPPPPPPPQVAHTQPLPGLSMITSPRPG